MPQSFVEPMRPADPPRASAERAVATPAVAIGLAKIERQVCVISLLRRITTPDDTTLQEVLEQVLVLVLGK
jgi:hypothetical protein